jgi:hypothetical protein
MNSSQLLSELPEDMSTELALEFDYGKLNTEIRMVVQQRTNEIRNLIRNTSQDIIEIGERLIDVKAQLKHGNFRNWLKAEFDWSIKTASRFMQVAEKFKCVTLTHLDISASALYLLASPSTPEEARTEVLKRANQGENITYSKAKVIISNYKKAVKPKPEKSVNFDTSVGTVEHNLIKFTQKEGNETSSIPGLLVAHTGKEAETEIRLLSTQYLVSSSEYKDKHFLPSVERNRQHLEDTTPIPSIINKTIIDQKIADTIISEIEIIIKQLPPDKLLRLAMVIINSINNKWNKCHLEAIITAAQKVLNQGMA